MLQHIILCFSKVHFLVQNYAEREIDHATDR